MNFDQWSVVAPTPTYKPIELDLVDDDADAAEIRSICCCDRTRCSHESTDDRLQRLRHWACWPSALAADLSP